jgi:hypothetical protein
MLDGPPELAQVRLDNALALFEEFVRSTARHADAAALRGLERRFAERIQIQPSYWSQIKGRSRQIGERLARQFEQLCQKPRGWMDVPHDAAGAATDSAGGEADDAGPKDDDERFIVGLVLTYYRRHPLRAKARLLDLLGEVLTPSAAATAAPPVPAGARGRTLPAGAAPHATPATPAEDPKSLWQRTQAGVAPLKNKK